MSNYVDVIIDEKVYSLGGSDNSDYIQMVAAYINDKIQTLKAQPYYYKQSTDTRNVMAMLSIADDYFETKQNVEDLKKELQAHAPEVNKLKKQILDVNSMLEQMERQLNAGAAREEQAKAEIAEVEQALEGTVEKDLEDMEGLKETIADLEIQLEECKTGDIYQIKQESEQAKQQAADLDSDLQETKQQKEMAETSLEQAKTDVAAHEAT